MRRFFLETVVLIAAAVMCAAVANALAANQRKLSWVGDYPNALKVPQQAAGSAPTAVAPAAVQSAPPVMTPADPAASTAAQASPTLTTPARTATAPPAQPSVVAPSPSSKQPPRAVDLSKFQPHPDKAWIEIAFEDVNALHQSGALFLDARRTDVYQQGHIAGARSFSVWEADVDQKVKALYGERSDPRDQDKPIVIYCSGGACEDSHMLAQKLWGIQFNNAYVYKDGYPDWVKRGGPVRQGPTP